MIENTCIIIITQLENLTDDKKQSFEQCLKIFGNKYQINVYIPDNISTKFYEQYDQIKIIKLNSKHFESIYEYNNLICSLSFWKSLSNFKYVLIYQLDCWVYIDNLEYFVNLNYDYYGSPWPMWNNAIGNGGFSLRKVNKIIEILEKYSYQKDYPNYDFPEDGWISYKLELNKCPFEIAANFAIEIPSTEILNTINSFPMGLHGRYLKKLWGNPEKYFLYKNKVLNNGFIPYGDKLIDDFNSGEKKFLNIPCDEILNLEL